MNTAESLDLSTDQGLMAAWTRARGTYLGEQLSGMAGQAALTHFNPFEPYLGSPRSEGSPTVVMRLPEVLLTTEPEPQAPDDFTAFLNRQGAEYQDRADALVATGKGTVRWRHERASRKIHEMTFVSRVVTAAASVIDELDTERYPDTATMLDGWIGRLKAGQDDKIFAHKLGIEPPAR